MAHYSPFPFAEITETQTYPHARTLRTSFAQKLLDTYDVLAGAPLRNNGHVGIFDYLTLYISTGLLFLMAWCVNNAQKNILAAVLILPVILINIPFLMARVVFGVVTTVLFSPITAIVHGISRLAAGPSYTEALALQGKLGNGENKNLGDYLTLNNMDLEELNITIKKSSTKEEIKSLEEGTASLKEENNSSSYQLMFQKKNTGLWSDYSLRRGKESFTVEIRQEKETNFTQAANIHALFKLNIGNVVKNIEKAADIDDKATILAI